MTDRERRWAFAVSAAVIACVVAALVALGPGDDEQESDAHTSATVIATRTPAVHVAPDPDSPQVRADTFVRAYLRYEVGDVGERVAGALRATATRALTRRLLSAPPQPPADRRAPAPGRLAGLDAVSPTGGVVALFSAEVDYDGVPATLQITLRRVAGGWRVSELR